MMHNHVTYKYGVSSNINGRDVQRKNVVNNVDKSSVWAPLQTGPYKNTQSIKNTKYTKTQQTIRNNYFLYFRKP